MSKCNLPTFAPYLLPGLLRDPIDDRDMCTSFFLHVLPTFLVLIRYFPVMQFPSRWLGIKEQKEGNILSLNHRRQRNQFQQKEFFALNMKVPICILFCILFSFSKLIFENVENCKLRKTTEGFFSRLPWTKKCIHFLCLKPRKKL